jgi:hypothetical protein
MCNKLALSAEPEAEGVGRRWPSAGFLDAPSGPRAKRGEPSGSRRSAPSTCLCVAWRSIVHTAKKKPRGKGDFDRGAISALLGMVRNTRRAQRLNPSSAANVPALGFTPRPRPSRKPAGWSSRYDSLAPLEAAPSPARSAILRCSGDLKQRQEDRWRAGFPRDRLAGVARMVTISITAEALLFAEA